MIAPGRLSMACAVACLVFSLQSVATAADVSLFVFDWVLNFVLVLPMAALEAGIIVWRLNLRYRTTFAPVLLGNIVSAMACLPCVFLLFLALGLSGGVGGFNIDSIASRFHLPGAWMSSRAFIQAFFLAWVCAGAIVLEIVFIAARIKDVRFGPLALAIAEANVITYVLMLWLPSLPLISMFDF